VKPFPLSPGFSSASLLVAAFMAATLAPAALAEAPPPPTATSNPVQPLIERYATDRQLIDAVYADPLAPATIERVAAFNHGWRKQLEALPFAQLPQQAKVDYLLLANHLDRAEHAQQLAAHQWSQVAPLLPIAANVFSLEEARRKIERPNPQQTAQLLNRMNAMLAAERNRLQATATGERPSHINAWRAAADVDLLHDRLKLWFDFYNSYDPQFSWWAADPWKQLDQQLTQYAAFLREQMAGIAPTDKATIIGTPAKSTLRRVDSLHARRVDHHGSRADGLVPARDDQGQS